MIRNNDSGSRDNESRDPMEEQEDENLSGPALDLEPDVRSDDAAGNESERALAALNDKYMRLAAEFDNFRRRINKERVEWGERAQASLASALLESLDDLARVTSAENEAADAASVMQGAELVARKLFKALNGAGLELIDPVNQPFDPRIHEAVSAQPAASAEEDDKVTAVFQPGYLFKGQLLRPARVVVSKWHG